MRRILAATLTAVVTAVGGVAAASPSEALTSGVTSATYRHHPVRHHRHAAPKTALPTSWKGWPITYLRYDVGSRYGEVTCYFTDGKAGGRSTNIYVYPAAVRDGRVLDVIKHEWIHTAECRDGEPGFGGRFSEESADAGALLQGAKWVGYTRHPSSAEFAYARRLLAQY